MVDGSENGESEDLAVKCEGMEWVQNLEEMRIKWVQNVGEMRGNKKGSKFGRNKG